MEIKDFKKGQPVFIVNTERRNGAKTSTVKQCTVTSVGRKYLKVEDASGYSWTFRTAGAPHDYLVEKTEYSSDLMLFPSRELADDYLYRDEQIDWARRFFGGTGGIWKLSTAQLREIRKIVEEWED